MKKKVKLGRPKLRSYKALRKEAWKTFSTWIRQRDNYTCFTCGKRDKDTSQAGHFIHRDCLDFDPRAIHTQCPKCNTYLSGNLVEYTLRMIEKYGQETVEELRALSYQVRKYSRSELEEIISTYKLNIQEEII